MTDHIRRPSLHPLAAAVLMAAIHSAIAFAMHAVADAGVGTITMLALLAMTLPAAVAGWLARSRPLVVALVGVALIWCVQLLATAAMLGTLSWGMVAVFLQGDLLQGVVLCVVCVAAFALRRRMRAHSA